ncbi:MAG: hypothetical protein A2X12_02950 [Bacteroidetes bacterium GWE2_29_8]|nr:MAG: hypothetical protein A2X12_02950 [Bacteroidetes bacterium GWE2_29_8]OFY15372.1 MAG: hypothetical protein A2X02_02965 [Bacteroidetes bacterium GWF2_29_10]
MKCIKKHRYVNLLLALFVIISISYSCRKDLLDFDNMASDAITPNWSIPLIHSKMDLSKILADYDHQDLIVEDKTKFLTLMYEGNVFSKTAEELINIPTQSYSETLTQNTNVLFDTELEVVYNYEFPMNSDAEQHFDSLYIKSGHINLYIESDYQHNGEMSITVKSLTKNGVPLVFSSQHTYTGSKVIISKDIDISGYKATFDNKQNKVKVEAKLKLDYKVANQTKATNQISATCNWNNIKFSKFYGYLGNVTFPVLKDDVVLKIFRNAMMDMGDIYIVNPRIDIIYKNSFGIPVRINFDKIEATGGKKAPYAVNLLSDLPVNPMNIIAPNYSQIGQYASDTISIVKTNALMQAISINPYYLSYDISASINDNGTTSNFALDTSKFAVDVAVKLPLYGRIHNFTLQDTLNFKFDKIEKIEAVKFKINIENGFPVETFMQVYFVDENYNLLDSIFAGGFTKAIKSAITDPATERVTSSVKSVIEANMTKDRLQNIYKVKYIFAKAVLNTEDNATKDVKFYSDYFLDVKIGVQAQFKLEY